MQKQKEESCLLFSSDVFPQDGSIVSVRSFLAKTKDRTAIPWGVAIQPLNPPVKSYV